MKQILPIDQNSNQAQRQSLQLLLRHTWKRSRFYRDYYSSYGIGEKDLADISISDLPVVSKQMLMENFDRAVTDPRLNMSTLEHWIQNNRDPNQQFLPDFVVIHSSGSSGRTGIFVHDRNAWRIADSAISTRLPSPENYPHGKTKAAFYMAADGHFALVSIAASLDRKIYDPLVVSMLAPRERIAEQLNRFMPHRIYGYSTSVAELADLAMEGLLHIQPRSIFVSGDVLTDGMERKLFDAWRAPIHVTYGASESKYIAVRGADEEELTVLDDLNIVEAVDQYGRPVAAHQEGLVLLTNLCNYSLPLIRYELGDYIVAGRTSHGSSLKTIRSIEGRAHDVLPVLLDDGSSDTIHPCILADFRVSDLEEIQFVSVQPDHVSILYVAPDDIDAAVRKQFQQILNSKGATRTKFDVTRVPHIRPDPNTNKLSLVRSESPSRVDSVVGLHGEGKPEETGYRLVVNEKQQYSILSSGNDIPVGWKDTGRKGSKEDCAGYIKQIRTDAKLPPAHHSVQRCIHQLFEEQAERIPHQAAVACGPQTLTYAELNERANHVAHHLRACGVKAGTLVAICVSRSVDIAIGILGILKAGGAWLPLDPNHPKKRQQLVLRDAGVPVLLTQNSLVSRLPDCGAQIVLLDHCCGFNLEDRTNLTGSSSPADLAYLMYTSGSTGEPKGVKITHGNVSHYVGALRGALALTDKDVYLHTATISFSASVRQLILPLTQGVKVVIATTDQIAEPLSLFEVIRSQGATVLDIAPSYWRSCIDALLDVDTPTRTRLLENQLRLVLTSSEALLPDLPRKWANDLNHPARLIHMYGQTETTGLVTAYTIPASNHTQAKPVPVGEPICCTEIYLLDEDRSLVPIGDVGEICVAGPALSPGYLNRPEKTSEKFVHNPFGDQKENRLYKTGDLARYRPDGHIEFLGRQDYQIKIHGVRVELGEVEAALVEHPDVREAVVAAKGDSHNKYLVAYFVPKQGHLPTTDALRSFLSEKLPQHVVPSAFVALDSLPHLPSGKVDRRSLPSADPRPAKSDKSFVAPRNSLELELTRIWQAITKVPNIGVTDNFFDFGADSLTAVRLISELEKVLGTKLPLTALFQAPTVEMLAKLIEEEPSEFWSSLVPIQPNGSKPSFFWIHGEASNAYLPKYLGPDQPLYGLEHQSQDGRPAKYQTVESIASHYLEEIRTVQPHGPYYIGGYCFGGLAALEIVQQLKESGESTKLVVLMDTRLSRPNGTGASFLAPVLRVISNEDISIYREFVKHFENLRSFGSICRRIINRIVQPIIEPIALKNAICTAYLMLGYPLPFWLRSFYTLQIYAKAGKQYKVQPYAGSVIAFVTAEVSSNTSTSGTPPVQAEVFQIPGNHTEILREPYLQVWAEKLRTRLREAQAASGTIQSGTGSVA